VTRHCRIRGPVMSIVSLASMQMPTSWLTSWPLSVHSFLNSTRSSTNQWYRGITDRLPSSCRNCSCWVLSLWAPLPPHIYFSAVGGGAWSLTLYMVMHVSFLFPLPWMVTKDQSPIRGLPLLLITRPCHGLATAAIVLPGLCGGVLILESEKTHITCLFSALNWDVIVLILQPSL
jgi:hypothetical protein